jgi:hypothetical protein
MQPNAKQPATYRRFRTRERRSRRRRLNTAMSQSDGDSTNRRNDMNQSTPLTLLKQNPLDAVRVVNEEPITALELRQELLSHHVRQLPRSLRVGLFVYGSGGWASLSSFCAPRR